MMPAIVALTVAVQTSDVVDWNRLVEAVAQVESGVRHGAVGDHGRARGAWQIHRAAWEDVSRVRAAAGLRTYRYGAAHDPATARAYASDFLGLLRARFITRTGRRPGIAELYCAYNLGLDGFARSGYRVARCPAATRAAAEGVYNLYCIGDYLSHD